MARLAPLGLLRLRVLSCLGGDTRVLPQYVPTPGPEQDVFAVYRVFAQQVNEQLRGEEGLQALLSTARLLTGDISGADDILNTLRNELVELDHGAGYCRVIPSVAILQALPLPKTIPQPKPNYVAGSPEQAQLRAWLAEHRAELVWDEVKGVYTSSTV